MLAKHNLLLCLGLGVSLLLLAFRDKAVAPAAPPPLQPNILFILADDLGYGDVGFTRGQLVTPVLDALARGGVTLQQHYATPQCTPSRAALLTGLFPSRLGDHATKAHNGKVLPAGMPTLASLLRKQGYRTGISGKWHVGVTFEDGPLHHGFERAYGILNGGCTQFGHHYKGPDSLTWYRQDRYLEEEGHTTDLLTQNVIDWIEEGAADDRPWFYYLPYTAVHVPIQVPGEWVDRYAEGQFYDDPRLDEAKRRYAGFVTQLDARIGDVLAALERSGQADNTIVVFTSDNGAPESWLYRGKYPQDTLLADSPVLGSNFPFRGWKQDVYEGGIRIPAIVRWPAGGVVRAVLDGPTHLVDWLPTLLEAAGCADCTPEGDGHSLLLALRGEQSLVPDRSLYWRFPGASALRHGDLKLLAFERGDGRTDYELYQLKDDPGEQRDLTRRPVNDSLVEGMKKRLAVAREQDYTLRLTHVPYDSTIQYGNLKLNPTPGTDAANNLRDYRGH
ncbi:sulfatase-like hydrolase/transferase [Neolewinella sp.]|uniref:sulfatase-like hydrolase/transferase n=1 Tax=Neolewinella sp. TaxID=2993543 RepID=UPI003B521F44